MVKTKIKSSVVQRSLFLVCLLFSALCFMTISCGKKDNPVQPLINITKKALKVEAGESHTCALLSDGTIKCWGDNYSGQLGNGTSTGSNIPILVSGITNVSSISAGMGYTCDVLSDGRIKCWGRNDFGQIGNGTTVNSSVPVSVLGIKTAIKVSSRHIHTCALLSDGGIKCWGYNYYGQLGSGISTGPETCDLDSPCSTTPLTVLGIDNAIDVTVGNNYTCALLSNGSVKCWGYNPSGLIMSEVNTYNSLTPVSISGLDNVTNIEAGSHHICALLSNGSVQCWGGNSSGQLGNGTNTSSNIPVTVLGINNAINITAGAQHTCVSLLDKSIRCWGWNEYGQIGNGTNINLNTPASVSEVTNATSISAGNYHTCALLSDGSIKCWGYNGYGQIGNGTNKDSYVPISVHDILYALFQFSKDYLYALLPKKELYERCI